MLDELKKLWRGELPLGRAFVGYVVIYGLAVNFLASMLALLAYALTSSPVLTLIVHFAALPYNILACTGAWKSINRYRGPPWLASMARLAVIGSFVVFLVI